MANQAPEVTASAGTTEVAEPGTSQFTIAVVDTGIVVTDADSAQLPSATVRIVGGYVAGQDVLSLAVSGYAASFDAGTGTLTITAQSGNSITNAVLRAVRYTNTSDNPTAGTRTIEFVVSDGIDASLAATKQLNLTPTNDGATIDLNGAASGLGSSAIYDGAAPQPVQLAPAATFADPDGGGYDGGSLVVTQAANTDPNARLSVLNQGNGAGQIGVSGSTISYSGTAIGTMSGGVGLTSLLVSLNANATIGAVEALTRQVAYSNDSANPPSTGPVYRFDLTDGAGAASTPANASVTNQGTGQAPVVTLNPSPLTVLEPNKSWDAFIQIDPNMNVTDSDSARLPSATIQITGNYVIGEDILHYAGGGPVSQSFDAETGTLTLAANPTQTIAYYILQEVYYKNTSDNPTPLERTIRVTVSDGVHNSAPVSRTLTIIPQDDPPVIDGNGPDRPGDGSHAAHLGGSTPSPLAPDAVIFDPDGAFPLQNDRLHVVLESDDVGSRTSVISRGDGPGQIGVSGNTVSYEGTAIGTLEGAGTLAERLTVTLNAATTPEAVQALVRSIGIAAPPTTRGFADASLTLYYETAGGPTSQISVKVDFLKASTPTYYGIDHEVTAAFGSGPAAGGWASQDTTPRVVADINGDGRADVIGFGYDRVYAMLPQPGHTFDGSDVYEVSSGFVASPSGGGWTSQDRYPRTFADVNGDGRADLVAFGDEGVAVALSTGTSLGAPFYGLHAFGAGASAGAWTSFDRYPRLLADVNGDGRADIVGFGEDTVYTALGKADGTFEQPVEAVDGFGASAAGGGWSSFEEFPRALADLDADGDDDLIGFGSGGVYVAMANGDGTFADPVFSRAVFGSAAAAGGWTSFDDYPRLAGDVNGDRFADLVGFGEDGVIVALGRGDGTFMAPELEMAGFGTAQGWTSQDANPRLLGDYTGDGILDIVAFGEQGISLSPAWSYLFQYH